MGNSAFCNYKPKVLKSDDKSNNKHILSYVEFKKLNIPFYNVNIRHRAIYIDDNNRDSIDQYNIQMTQDNEWKVQTREPKGSLYIGKEYDTKKQKESSQNTYFNIQQAHSIKSQNVRLTCDSNFYNTTKDKQCSQNQAYDGTSYGSTNIGNTYLFSTQENFEPYCQKDYQTQQELLSKIMKIDLFKSGKSKLKHPNYILKYVRNELKYFDFEVSTIKRKFYYKGEQDDRMRHGMGKLFYGNINNIPKEFLESNFENTNKKGQANNLVEPNENQAQNPYLIYEGPFLCDAIHNSNAKVYYPNGKLFYHGSVFFGRKQGYGKAYYFNGIFFNLIL